MPLVRIEIVEGHTDKYKKTFLNSVHDGLKSALGISDEDIFQKLYEIENDYFEKSNEKTEKFCIIELTIFPGRSREVKGNVIKEISRLLGERLAITPSDIFIVIQDPPVENWGLEGVQKE